MKTYRSRIHIHRSWLLIIVLLCFVKAFPQKIQTGPQQAQTKSQQITPVNVALNMGHRITDTTKVSYLNIGLLGVADSLKGVQVSLLGSKSVKCLDGLQTAGLLNGANRLNGVQLAGISNTGVLVKGLQVAPFSNIAAGSLRGVQIVGLTNIASDVSGVQLAGVTNIAKNEMRGVQMGVSNYADTLRGVQIGLFNVAHTHPGGWQIGLANYTRDTLARKIGLVNISPRTRIDLLFFMGNTSKFNIAARFRNRSTFNIVGFGTHYMGLDERFSGALFYRLGQYFQLSPRWMLSGDVGFYHIETFKRNSGEKGTRLYSYQAHLNVDYQLNKTLGLFASVGYGDTRYYKKGREYEHGFIGQAGVTFRYPRPAMKWDNLRRRSGQAEASDSVFGKYAFDTSEYRQKRPWMAALEVTGINVLVNVFDRYVQHGHFAEVNFKTFWNNVKHGFVWDNDKFSTNLFAHPYHGNLYFNSARSNGLNFWESAPYAFGGSLMWEFAGEREPPAINDLMATTMGGVCIGEVMHRSSLLVLDDRTKGFPRFLREFTAFFINPVQGFNRLVTGNAWRVRGDHYLYHDFNRIPVNFSLSIGNRYLADEGALFRGENQPFLRLGMEYGDPFDGEVNNKPYDYFTAAMSVGFTGNQPIVNRVHLLGRIWSTPMYTAPKVDAIFGIFQHFNYYDSKPVKDGSDRMPYRISEAASFGPGIIYRFLSSGGLAYLEQRIFASGILLGGTKSDYYNVIQRDYNMGSGVSVKLNTVVTFRNRCSFTLLADYYRIFTWKGYEGKDLANIDPVYLNVQGDKSNAELFVLSPNVSFPLARRLSVELNGSYFLRKTRYKFHPDVKAHTFEVSLGIACML